MREVMNFFFSNFYLILIVAIGYYIYTQYKDLKEKDAHVKELFSKTLAKYIDGVVEDLKNKVTPLKEKYTAQLEAEHANEEEESVLTKKVEHKTDIVINDLNRLLMILEKTDTINQKVEASNAINKYSISGSIDFEEYPDMKVLENVEIFTEEIMNSQDNGIAIARREYNAWAFRYNERATSFPIQYFIKLLRLVPTYTVFDAPKTSNYEENFEVFEEVEPEINSLASLNLTREEIEREEAEQAEAKEKENEEVVIEHSDVVLKPSTEIKEDEEKKD